MISVVIPVGPKNKLDVLNSLRNQKLPVEIIVEEGRNPSKNRNEGVKKAKSNFVAFVNSHTIVPDDWSEKVEKFFLEHPSIDILGGPQLTPPNSSNFVRASGYCLSSIFSTGNTNKRYKLAKGTFYANETQLTSANLICRKKVLKKVKFDETIWPGEDPKFILDSKEEGFNVAYSPNIFVFHKRRETLKELSSQIMNYAIRRSSVLRSTIWRNPLFLIPSIFLVYLFLFPFFLLFNSLIPLTLLKLLILPSGVYFVSNALFTLVGSVSNKDISALKLMPVIFLTVQISYGLGFIKGVFRNGS